MSNTNKVILDKPGVRACGPLRAGVVYEISNAAERERLVKAKKFRPVTDAEEKRFSEEGREVKYTARQGDSAVEIVATAWKEPEKKEAEETPAAPGPAAPAAEDPSAGDEAAKKGSKQPSKQEDK